MTDRQTAIPPPRRRGMALDPWLRYAAALDLPRPPRHDDWPPWAWIEKTAKEASGAADMSDLKFALLVLWLTGEDPNAHVRMFRMMVDDTAEYWLDRCQMGELESRGSFEPRLRDLHREVITREPRLTPIANYARDRVAPFASSTRELIRIAGA